MRYVLDRKTKNKEIISLVASLEGLSIEPKKRKVTKTLIAKKVTITDQKLIDEYVKININKKIYKILKLIIKICNDEDSTPKDADLALNDLGRLKSIVVGKYKKYISKKEYKELLAKIFLIEDEFKDSFSNKLFMKQIEELLYEEERGKSR